MNSIAIVFTSVLSSGVVATAISFSFSEAKERWLLRRSKIEEIYLSGAAWLMFVNARFLPYLRVCNGSLTYSQVLDLEIKNADKSIGDQHLKMKMNIEMCERSLVPALRLMEQELEKLNKVRSDLTDCYAKTGQASTFGVPLRNQLLAFVTAGDALKDAAVKRGTEIGAERGQVAQAHEWGAVKTKGYAERSRLNIAKFLDWIRHSIRSKR